MPMGMNTMISGRLRRKFPEDEAETDDRRLLHKTQAAYA